jgi:hypothetical protein
VKSKESDFFVTVCRIAYGYRTVNVRARSKKEALDKAIETARDYEFPTHYADYVCRRCRRKLTIRRTV